MAQGEGSPHPRGRRGLVVLGLLALSVFLFDRAIYPRLTLWWWGRADVIWADDSVPAVGAPSAEEAALRFVVHWVDHPGEALSYVSRDPQLVVDHEAFRDPQLPEMHTFYPFGPWLTRDQAKLLRLIPIPSAPAKAHLAEIELDCPNIMDGERYRFVVVQGRRGRWFAAGEGLEMRNRRYLAIFNNGPWEEELDFDDF